MLHSLSADLIAEMPPGGRYAEAARGWLDGVLAEVFPDLLTGLRTRPATRLVTGSTEHLPWGEPGQVRGVLRIGLDSPVPRREVQFSDAAWRRMLDSLGKSPMAVSLDISVLAGDGFPDLSESPHVFIHVTRWPFEREWVRFTFCAAAAYTGWPESPQLQGRWAGFVKTEAARIGAFAGFMTDDRLPGHDTALEQAIWPGPPGGEVGKHRRREVLYGYSWVTIVPPDLARRLGGAAGLSASGAFYDVSELPDGSVWLRATPAINEFTGDAIRRVFETLAPVLVTGPTKFLFGFRPRLVEGVDAADYQHRPAGQVRPGGPDSGTGPAAARDPAAAGQAVTGAIGAGVGERAPRAALRADRLPAGLPAGRLVVPDPQFNAGTPVAEPALWVSDEPVRDAGRWWARLVREHRATGLWPLLLTAVQEPDLAAMFDDPDGGTAVTSAAGRPWQSGELAPVPASSVDGVDAEQVLAEGWHVVSGDGIDFGEDAVPAVPYRSWPGLADPAAEGADPDEHAASLAVAEVGIAGLTGRGDPPLLGLVPAPDGAAAIAVCGWLSPAGGGAETAAVVRSWQDRFGARLCSLGIDTMVLAVAWPPATSEHARRVAAEHFAFCHELTGLMDFDEYAQALIGASIWSFWWD